VGGCVSPAVLWAVVLALPCSGRFRRENACLSGRTILISRAGHFNYNPILLENSLRRGVSGLPERFLYQMDTHPSEPAVPARPEKTACDFSNSICSESKRTMTIRRSLGRLYRALSALNFVP
jgi:hypothetical protein